MQRLEQNWNSRIEGYIKKAKHKMLIEAESSRIKMLEVFDEIKFKLCAEIDKYCDENYSDESLSITKMFELKT